MKSRSHETGKAAWVPIAAVAAAGALALGARAGGLETGKAVPKHAAANSGHEAKKESLKDQIHTIVTADAKALVDLTQKPAKPLAENSGQVGSDLTANRDPATGIVTTTLVVPTKNSITPGKPAQYVFSMSGKLDNAGNVDPASVTQFSISSQVATDTITHIGFSEDQGGDWHINTGFAVGGQSVVSKYADVVFDYATGKPQGNETILTGPTLGDVSVTNHLIVDAAVAGDPVNYIPYK